MLTKDERAIELKNVWVFECWHDLYSGIHKNVVSGPNPTEEEKQQNGQYNHGWDGWTVELEDVLFIDGVPNFLHL
jgi:hypothetical protein